jgi:hypothetical protein
MKQPFHVTGHKRDEFRSRVHLIVDAGDARDALQIAATVTGAGAYRFIAARAVGRHMLSLTKGRLLSTHELFLVRPECDPRYATRRKAR